MGAQLTGGAGTSWELGSMAMAALPAGPGILLPPHQMCRERQGLLQDSCAGRANPACHPPQNMGTRCCAGPNMQEESMLSGLDPLSGQGVLVPFQTLPLASEQAWLCPWLCGQWGQLRFPSDPLCDNIPGCRLAPSLISHGWIPGFMLAGCLGDGWAHFPSLPHFPALTLPCVRATLPQRCCNQRFPAPTISRQQL